MAVKVTVRNQDGGTINRGDYCYADVTGGTPNTAIHIEVNGTNGHLYAGSGRVAANGTASLGFPIPTDAKWGVYTLFYQDGGQSTQTDFSVLNS